MPAPPSASAAPTRPEAAVLTRCPLARLALGPVQQDGLLLVARGRRVSAVAAACPHAGVALEPDGPRTVSCPSHGARFRLSDGRALAGPTRRRLPVYRVEVDGEHAVVHDGPAHRAPLLRSLVARLLRRSS